MTDQLEYLTVSEGAARISDRTLSPVDWVEALLRRIDAFDGDLRSFLVVTGEAARAQAIAAERAIAAGDYLGPLHGVPYALKDIYDTAGVPTTGQSRVCWERVPQYDAFAHRKLREAGAVLIGKNATHEFAYGGPSTDLPAPLARNPWSPAHFPGGSSSGSGVAVAAGLVPVSLGSDTGGSIRHPAAHCGLVGLKPTAGLVGRSGILPLAYSFDTAGPLTRTVEDAALVLQGIAGYDAADPQSVRVPIPDYRRALTGDIRNVRIGVIRHFYEVDKVTAAPIKTAIEAALAQLAKLGAEIREIHLSPLDDFAACQWLLSCVEANAIHDDNLHHRLNDYGENFRYRILPGATVSAVEYVQAQRMRQALVRETLDVMTSVDVVLTATTAVTPPALDEMTLASALSSRGITAAFNTIGGPALALCSGFTPDGLPVSLTIGGKPFDECTVLRVAHAYQHATDWHKRHPVVSRANPAAASANA